MVKNTHTNAEDIREVDLIPGLGRSPGGRARQPTPLLLSEESHG